MKNVLKVILCIIGMFIVAKIAFFLIKFIVATALSLLALVAVALGIAVAVIAFFTMLFFIIGILFK